ncbi:calcium-binding protein [Algicella marina]|uniref:Peptidase M10 serralysin C-terminal domain-containing protein n=1 Tax=Algicella marina TaxID=2683284 RepID=A0A6P1T398_9RHOB|nr:hypothetical protein [Algicella marina]QHQ36205.1 hypothetical protein GO499_14025 [Algicella marina]
MSFSVFTGFVAMGETYRNMQGISDIVIINIGGVPFIAVGSEAYGSVNVFDVGAGVPVLASSVEYSPWSGTATLSDMALLERESGRQLLTLGRYDDNFGLYDISLDGTLSHSRSLQDESGRFERGFVSTVQNFRDYTVIYSARFGTGGVQIHRLFEDGTVEFQRTLVGGWAPLSDVTTIEYSDLHGQRFLFAASGIDTGVTVFDVNASGNLRVTGRHLPRDGDGLYGITDVAPVQVAERAFLVVGSSETDSLTVLRVSRGGELNQVEHLIDTRDTRFGGVAEVEVVEAAGRVFVFAGGGDDGIAVLELDYRGRLHHLASIADDFGTTLQNVSALEVRVVGNQAHLYVGSATENGITELIVDLERGGQDLRGGAIPETLSGTAGNDIIWGMGRGDMLYGRAGDDRLVDGRGRDTLSGGPGADIFEFIEDGRNDFIIDFQFGHDRIDLSAFDHLYHFTDLTIGPRLTGAAIIVGEEIIRLYSSHGGPINTDQFTQDHFIFG